MIRRLMIMVALSAAACDGRESEAPPPRETVDAAAPLPAAPPPVAPAPVDRAGRSPAPEAPSTAEGAQGAANVARTYYALIEAGRYEEAWRLRWESGGASAADAAVFVKQFDRYRDYHATIGAPSRIAGAAGSLYVDVPVQIYGRLRDGKPFGTAGTVTLRRLDDPGSTDERSDWRIFTR